MLSRLVIAFLPSSKHLLISKLQSLSAVILEPQNSLSLFPLFHHLFAIEVMGPDAMILVFWMSFKPAFSLSSFTLKKLFSSYSHLDIYIVDISLTVLISSCASSRLAFHMMYSAENLNKQGDNIQSWCTPFTIWNQSIVPCPVLTVASWPACRFLRRQVRWSGIPVSFRIFHSLLWSTPSKT